MHICHAVKTTRKRNDKCCIIICNSNSFENYPKSTCQKNTSEKMLLWKSSLTPEYRAGTGFQGWQNAVNCAKREFLLLGKLGRFFSSDFRHFAAGPGLFRVHPQKPGRNRFKKKVFKDLCILDLQIINLCVF